MVIAIVCINMNTVSAQFTKEQATNLVLNQVLQGELVHIDVFMQDEPLDNTDTIVLRDGTTVLLPYASNWAYFVDDVPPGNWAHPCRFIFVNAADGSYQLVQENFFPMDWQTAYDTVSEMPRSQPLDLPTSSEETTYQLEPNPNLYAVIINGSETNVRYWLDVSAIYCTLLEAYGYTKENIFVHWVDGSSNYWYPYLNDLDGDESDDIDFDAHKGTIEHTFMEMAGETNTPDEIPELGPEDQLFIFVTGHGDTVNGQSYFMLPDGWLYDNELASYLEHINCAQIITVLEPCFSGGFIPELTDYINYDVSCKNRSIHTSNTLETSYMECWITGFNYDEFVYYWTAAARGHYPNDYFPWEWSEYVPGSFPFTDPVNGPGLITHPGDYDPDTNGDGFVQMEEAFDYANYMDTWSEYGFDSLYNEAWGDYETPMIANDISFEEDLLSLSGLVGHITATQTVESRDYMAGGQLVVDPGANLTIENGGNLYFGNETAGLSVDPGAGLIIEDNVGFYGNVENRININGNIQVGDYVSFNNLDNSGYFSGLYLNNYNLETSLNYAAFNKSGLRNYGNSLDISHSTFNECHIAASHRGNVTVTGNTVFDQTWLFLENTEDNQNTATVTDCDFTTNNTMVAIDIWNYNLYNISNNTIDGYYNGIQLYQSGYGNTKKNMISDNTITNCAFAGISAYGSLSNVYRNHITNNKYGVWFGNHSSLLLNGNHNAVSYSQTQEIRDNDSYEVYASQYSFPTYFRYNVIIDEDNLGAPDDPMVYHSPGSGGIAFKDVKYNCWGVNFAPTEDLYPSGYNWDPVWCPDIGGGIATEADEDMYEVANNLFEAEDYTGAKGMYEMLIEQYPQSKFAKAAIQELFALEKFATDDYNNLKQYYENNTDLELATTKEYMVSKCDIKLENWPDAISYYENIILDPETMEDSIFAIIDLGYVYFIMENSGYKSTYTGNLVEYKPESKMQFFDNRDYLLSLIPGDQLSVTMKGNIAGLKEGELLQNVPNPFKGSTQFWYKLQNESIVQLNVYNYTGQLISTINEGTKTKGIHHIDFDANGLKNGIYFYSISINGQTTDSKKMTVME